MQPVFDQCPFTGEEIRVYVPDSEAWVYLAWKARPGPRVIGKIEPPGKDPEKDSGNGFA